jgi:hypothetical protein
MGTNVGTIDRVLRVIIGLALLSQVWIGLMTPWGYIGIIPLLTAVVGICPLYSILGVKTCSR